MLFLLTVLFLACASKKKTFCGSSKCAFKVNNKALLLAVKGSCNLSKEIFKEQILQIQVANEQGLRTPAIVTTVKTFEREEVKDDLASYWLTLRKDSMQVLNYDGTWVQLCEPIFGFEQDWVEGMFFKFRKPYENLNTWRLVLAEGMTNNGWKLNFKEDMILELSKFKTFLEKDNFVTMNTQFIINYEQPRWKLYVVDIELGAKDSSLWKQWNIDEKSFFAWKKWNLDEIAFFTKFLETYKNPTNLREAVTFLMRFSEQHDIALSKRWTQLDKIIVQIMHEEKIITTESFKLDSVWIKKTGGGEGAEVVAQVAYELCPSDSSKSDSYCVGKVYFQLALIEVVEVADYSIRPGYSVCITAHLDVIIEDLSKDFFNLYPFLGSAITRRSATICFF